MTKSKVLFLDIETSLSVVGTFSLYPESINHNNIIREPFIMCASYKLLGEKKVHSVAVSKSEALVGNDKKVVQDLIKAIDNADVVIAHNGDKFDIKYIRGRALKHSLPPVALIKTVDTLKVARRYFKVLSNRLDYLGQYLGVGKKIKTSGDMWMSILNGDMAALKKMVIYNKQDVILLEKVYLKLRGWMDTGHPPTNSKLGQCKVCSSSKISKEGTKRLSKGLFQKFRCNSCGHVFKGDKPLETKE